MKLAITIATIGIVAAAIGVLQKSELDQLRARTTALESEVTAARSAVLPVAETAPEPTATKRVDTGLPAVSLDEDAAPEGESSAKAVALNFIKETERIMNGNSRLEAAVKLVPLLNSLSTEELKELLTQAHTSQLGPQPKHMLWKIVLGKLVKSEPEEAMRLTLEVARHPTSAFTEGFQAWIDHDPDAALAWYEGRKEAGNFPKEPHQLAVIAEGKTIAVIASRDIDQAYDLIAEEVATSKTYNVRTQMMRSVAKAIDDDEKWQRFAERTSKTEDKWMKREGLNVLARRAFSVGDPEEQITRIEELELDEGQRYQFVQNAVSSVPSRNSKALANWTVANLPADHIPNTIPQMVSRWGRNDPENVTEWVDSLPAGPVLDAARTVWNP